MKQLRHFVTIIKSKLFYLAPHVRTHDLAPASCRDRGPISNKPQPKKIANALVGYFLWQGPKDDYQTYRELNSLQGVYGNMILL